MRPYIVWVACSQKAHSGAADRASGRGTITPHRAARRISCTGCRKADCHCSSSGATRRCRRQCRHSVQARSWSPPCNSTLIAPVLSSAVEDDGEYAPNATSLACTSHASTIDAVTLKVAVSVAACATGDDISAHRHGSATAALLSGFIRIIVRGSLLHTCLRLSERDSPQSMRERSRTSPVLHLLRKQRCRCSTLSL